MQIANAPAGREPGRSKAERAAGALLIALGVVAIAVITLTPAADRTPLPIFCLTCGDRPAVDFLLNILLFVPLGLGLALIGLELRRALMIGIAATLCVEFLQFIAIAGRYASARDVISNSCGVLGGFLVGHYWRSLAFPSPRTAWRAFAIGALLWVAGQAATAWAMQLDLPPTPWWGQIKPQYDRYPSVFEGRIITLSVGAVPVIENDTIPGAAGARRQLTEGASLRAAITDVQPTRGIAPVFIVVATPPDEVAMWLLDGNDAVFAATVRGSTLGLRGPSIVLPDVIPANRGDTLTLTGSYAGGYYRLESDDGHHIRTRVFGVSPSLGWALVIPLPWYAFGPDVRLATACWLAAIWLVLGYWAARVSPGRVTARVVAAALATLIIGLALVPVAFRFPPVHWSEWLASMIGVAFAFLAVRAGATTRALDDAAR